MRRLLLAILLIVSLVSCTYSPIRPTDEEYYTQRIMLPDIGMVILIHHGGENKCAFYRPIFKEKGKILNYSKWKNHIYCSYCWDKLDMDVLDACSFRNLWRSFFCDDAEAYHLDPDNSFQYPFWEKRKESIIDTTNRQTYLQYALRGGEMTRISSDIIPDEYWYIQNTITAGLKE